MAEFNHRLLIVDDEAAIRSLIKRYFEKRGGLVYGAASGTEMHQILASQPVDLVLLDVQLPGKDGFALLDEVKQQYKVGVIMLTVQNELSDRLTGLNRGADDYIPKPFEMSELLARANAVLRRLDTEQTVSVSEPETSSYSFSGYCLHGRTRELRDPAQQIVELSPAEFDLLMLFVKHPQTVLSRDYLLQQTRGRDSSPYDRTIDVRVGKLRKKVILQDSKELLFKTVRGGGYMLNSTVS